MTNDPMTNPLYIRQHAGFSQWLRILNFEPTSQRDMPKMLREFLEYLEAQDCHQPRDIREAHILDYLDAFEMKKRRRKTTKMSGETQKMSKNYLRKQLQVIRKYSRYLTENGQESFQTQIKLKGSATSIKQILTGGQIEQLYQSTAGTIYGIRDQALLALYYGCGLRKNEGIQLNLSDIQLDKDLVYVRKGKGYQERYVPLSGKSKASLETYITYARPYLAGNRQEPALLLSALGKRLSGATAYERLHQLSLKAGIRPGIGLHTLRHSIATHLLGSGMKLEQIQRFLGHSSLESTQIYTHITHENQP